MFTTVTRPVLEPAELVDIPYKIAESISATLCHRLEIRAEVKLPNDVVVSSRKLCGVLCNSRISGDQVDWLLCGIGLNTTMRASDLPFAEATSLHIEGCDVPDHATLLTWIVDDLDFIRGSGQLA